MTTAVAQAVASQRGERDADKSGSMARQGDRELSSSSDGPPGPKRQARELQATLSAHAGRYDVAANPEAPGQSCRRRAAHILSS
mmetsp:Transcript_1330/g.5287  ORF Transcript_1330/g.5287 Transcript_1330/m.5287 type:complete len:84 (+) Transcript_1330:117-368(+)